MWVSPSDHKIIGNFLADVRRGANVTQIELAGRLDKPQSFVSSYERGQRRIDFLEFGQVMVALGRDPEAVGREVLALVVPIVTDTTPKRSKR